MKYKQAILSSVIAGNAGLVLGYDMGISGGTIDYVTKHFTLDASMSGFALSVFIVGAVIGSIFTRWLNDTLGRKKALLIGALIMLIGAIGVFLLGANFSLFLLSRGIAGAGMGVLFSSEPSYITEIAPKNIRGALGSILQLTTGIGIIIGYSVTFLMVANASTTMRDSLLWRDVYGTEIIICVAYLLSLLIIVQSPIWLLFKQRDQEAKQMIEALWPDVNADAFITAHIANHRNPDASKNVEAQMKKNGKYFRFLFIVFFMAALTELCGINPIIYYAPNIFGEIVKETSQLAFIQSILNGVFFTLGSLCSLLFVDRFGRKTLLFLGTAIMSLCLLAIGIAVYFNYYSILLVVLIYLFIFSYNFSAGPIRFLYIGELAPTELRASSLGIGGVINWISDFLVAWTLPIMAGSTYLNRLFHGSSIYFLYAIFGIIYFFLIFTIPETKGKSLHEIDEYWKIQESN